VLGSVHVSDSRLVSAPLRIAVSSDYLRWHAVRLTLGMSTSLEPASDDVARAYRWLTAAQGRPSRTTAIAGDELWRQRAARGLLRALATAVERVEPRARGHAERVGGLSRRLALCLGLTPEEAEIVCQAGLLHDIGNIGRPSGDEGVERRHPMIGAQLVAPFEFLALAAPMIRHHHERLDGSGYPDGLRGATIPVGARIIAVADEYDHLTTAAAGPALSHDAAVVHLAQQGDRTLDGSVLSALIDLSLP
jgi:HD-GYP domain-containing protein (c-di-GMP phosphodiesterase class II)